MQGETHFSSPLIWILAPAGTVVMLSVAEPVLGGGLGLLLLRARLTTVTRMATAPSMPMTAPMAMARFQFNPPDELGGGPIGCWGTANTPAVGRFPDGGGGKFITGL